MLDDSGFELIGIQLGTVIADADLVLRHGEELR